MSHYTINTVEGDRAEIVFHGVPYADFDRTGHWSIWAIAKMFEASRLIPLYHGFLHFQQVDGAHHGLVVRKQVLRLNPKLHQNMSIFSNLMMKFNLEVLSLGKTSVTYVSRFTDGESGELLAENFVKFVRINRKTRRAAEFPSFFQEMYGVMNGKETLPFLDKRIIAGQPPQDAYTYKVLVRSSDTDRNRHVNQAMYVKYCMDCATEAAINKYYKNFDSDMCMYTTTKWEIDYIGESGTRDLLEIVTWQSCDDLRHIGFLIRMEQKEIFRASTMFELQKQISPVKRNKSARL
ncbi:hypothetical protein FSP39_011420 [Pinctada imbricata]|uniref:Acyl-ACP thioesterase-like C-terminal domain-containing protein n=1 Tax=Pinctada imbricata TaxID=66713 RepID=A0AA88XLX0_PINIB|nr:hypothetical protein FSP39_011420 [Pinctada imbricata]